MSQQPTKKSGGSSVGKVLGSISPLFGAISGEGMFGGLRQMSPIMMAIDATKKKKKDGATTTTETEEVEMRKGGKAKAKPVKKMAKGGSVSKRADGCCSKGKTKGKMV